MYLVRSERFRGHPDPRMRYCHECSRHVVLCRRDAELRVALAENECVAVDIPGPRGLVRTVGVIDPECF